MRSQDCQKSSQLRYQQIRLTTLVKGIEVHKSKIRNETYGIQDSIVKKSAPTITTGRKWNPKETVLQTKVDLKPTENVGQVQDGRGEFGLGKSKPRK